ncbi:hypothetical protein A6A04_13650 [Paramagnetospirillum marisnigri]|uniref:Methyltransferase type 11 domain-containing protein n=2 Tax=Paramagnetospirillum marisnigri TaxID=1285242 RepID=A0A178MUW3_9PROT|nr:hypothetical protein A6A04_13650 [Paramagnetospirillum marisnigri]
MDEVYRRHNAGDQVGAFVAALAVIRDDPGLVLAQIAALKLISRAVGDTQAGMFEQWLQSTGFGNLDNAAVILPALFECPAELYAIGSILAVITASQGRHREALAVFGSFLTADLPAPLAKTDVAKEYGNTAEVYDQNILHTASVDFFTAFLDRSLPGQPVAVAVDVPCGSGMAGPWLRQRSGRLIGSDLSAHMSAMAEASGHYDQVICGDMVEVLPNLTVDLVVSHGSLYYFRDLVPVAAEVAKALRPGGWFAFTDYPAPCGTMATISGNLRYCRAPDLVRAVMTEQGLEESACEWGLTFGLPCVYWLFRKA